VRRSDQAFAQLVAEVSCHGFTFTATENHSVTVTMDCAAFGADRIIEAEHTISPDQTDEEALLELLAICNYLATHEVQEAFRVQGDVWRSPHPTPAFELRLIERER
jgi:hypothetical protein